MALPCPVHGGGASPRQSSLLKGSFLQPVYVVQLTPLY